jgi:hypothetical protein
MQNDTTAALTKCSSTSAATNTMTLPFTRPTPCSYPGQVLGAVLLYCWTVVGTATFWPLLRATGKLRPCRLRLGAIWLLLPLRLWVRMGGGWTVVCIRLGAFGWVRVLGFRLEQVG